MTSISNKIVTGLRGLMSRPNERGIRTSDIFRLKVREKVRNILRDAEGLIIDIGCGEGYLLENVLSDGRLKAALFDNCPAMLQKVVEGYFPGLQNCAYPIRGEAGLLPFRDNAFDYAVCVSTFYNLPSKDDVITAMKNIGRIVKTGGRFIFDIRNRNNPLVKRAYEKVQSYDPSIADLPLNAYTIDEASQILRSAGFKIRKSYGMYFPLKSLAPIIVIEAEKV
ncbi:class I SAM-dependent methyltransferase [bacterium]|nr:class I SAM-dependent methyltransferase [FCB group bacterium]MBL7190398.1 class I SAM-dependent methyltransferase [bacterium]